MTRLSIPCIYIYLQFFERRWEETLAVSFLLRFVSLGPSSSPAPSLLSKPHPVLLTPKSRTMEVRHFQWEFLLGLPRENYYPIRDASAFLLITGFPPKNIKVTWVVYNYPSFYEPLRVCSSLFSLWLLFPPDSLQIYRQVAPKSPSSGPSSNFLLHNLSLTDQLP